MGEAARSIENTGGDGVEISFVDEMDLRAFFGMASPPVPGLASSFGPMCARASMKNRRSSEQPTPFVVHRDGTTSGAPWTELVECSGVGASAAHDVEDAFVAYLDGQRRMGRVWAVLERLDAIDVAVLEAHYSSSGDAGWPFGGAAGVALLTTAARRENRARAARDQHESIENTVASLVFEAKDAKRPRVARDAARRTLLAIRRESASMLSAARTRYTQARREVRGCR